ncbi:MAG: hypothetical protein SFY92_07905 [Verrucomicrobiae bacterium]|nr:hypothetical protein [Verrucomicrobiae bacterium]
MKINSKNLLAAAAIAGLISGGLLSHVNAGQATDGSTSSLSEKEKGACGSKDGCKGKNECKGKGGCKSGDNGCKGKNSCKGKGGCGGKEGKEKGACGGKDGCGAKK